jgi:MFS family permease
MAKMPRGVVALGFVSLFMDVSSEMVQALLPIYLTAGLGASVAMVGLIEGVGQGTAQIMKLFSGLLADWTLRRKPLAVLGYGLSALTKPIFYLAGSAHWILGARVADRVGKGIRGTPRDAMVADMVPPEARAAAFGLRQSMDSFGAFLGPALAIGLMLGLGASIPQVFLVSVLPATLAVVVLVVYVREPAPQTRTKRGFPLSRAAMARFGPGLWAAILLGGVMTMARISDAFLILRASDAGLAVWALPLVLMAVNAVDSATAWPVGILADKIGKRGLLLAGFGVLMLANLVLGLSASLPAALIGAGFWGLHMGLTQGLLAAMVADAAPPDLRGTAFGLFNLVTGLALVVGNLAAGWVWSGYGAEATFLGAAALAGLAVLLGLVGARPTRA